MNQGLADTNRSIEGKRLTSVGGCFTVSHVRSLKRIKPELIDKYYTENS